MDAIQTFIHLPVVNIVVICLGAALLLFVATFALKKLNVRSIGPIQLEHESATTMYHLNSENTNCDAACLNRLRAVTNDMRLRLSTIFLQDTICPLGRITINNALRNPLYESVNNNHFTRELMPDHFASFHARIIDKIKYEYVSIAIATKGQCQENMPRDWEEVELCLLDFVNQWILLVCREVQICCEQKIENYVKYAIAFEKAKDAYR